MLPRYRHADPYALEEFRREYAGSDWRRRIRLLRRHLRQQDVPNAILSLALRDDHAEVRQWIARHVPLSDAARDVLSKDPDVFVRACLWENPHCLPYKNLVVDWKSAFDGCTCLERLAFVRNPKVPTDLIERIFDPTDTDLAIELAERHELAVAALTNEVLLRRLGGEAGLTDKWLPTDGYGRYLADRFLTNLWEKASAWPDGTAIRHLTYQHVPTTDEVKATWYEKSSTALRGAILDGCGPDDRQTLALAMRDPDELKRYQAYATVAYLTHGQVEALLAGNDYMSLDAACCNRVIDVEARQKILNRLRELGHNDEPWLDEAERELKAAKAKERKQREEAGDSFEVGTSEEFDADLEDSEAHQDPDAVSDVGDESSHPIIDNSVIDRRIKMLASRQRRFERRVNRRLTGIEKASRTVSAFVWVVPDLLALTVAGVSLSWLAWALLPRWAGGLAILFICCVVSILAGKVLERTRDPASKESSSAHGTT